MKSRIIYKIIILALGVVFFTSCEKWLDVSPKAQIKETDQFSSDRVLKMLFLEFIKRLVLLRSMEIIFQWDF